MRISKRERKRKKKLQMKNKRLIKKYYWLVPRNVWTGKIIDGYDYTWINWGCSPGWDKAYGMMYLKELGDEINRINQKNFQIVQIKEKYGQHRVYTNGTAETVHRIIDKYETISEHLCYYCGREAPMTDTGWIMPMCLDCFIKLNRRISKQYGEKNISEEELIQKYNNSIIDKPDENGEYKMPNSYKITRYEGGQQSTIEYDISDTVNKIRKRQSKLTQR